MKIKNNFRKFHKNDDGFSLIELLVAIVLLAVIVGAFLSAFEFTTRNNITSGQVVDTGYDAQTVMEEIISLANNNPTFNAEALANEVAALANEVAEGSVDVQKTTTNSDGREITTYTTTYTTTKVQDGHSMKIIITENAFEYPNLLKIWIETVGSSSDSEASIQNIISIGE